MNDMTVVRPDDLDAPFEDRVIAALRALIAQGAWSRDDDTSMCCYRAPGGGKCFAGMMIPDDCYELDLEGMSADKIPYYAWSSDKPTTQQVMLMSRLQCAAHDALSHEPFEHQKVVSGAIFACAQAGYTALAERIRAEL